MIDDSFYDLMFEVSNNERVKIMKALLKERDSFSGLARKLDITTQEISRHFSRLVDSGLAIRGSDSHPQLTPYGIMVLRHLDSIVFTAKNRDYFVTHDATQLPNKFLTRLGELKAMNYTDDVMVVIHNSLRILKEAEEYVLDLNLPYISSSFPLIKEAYQRGVKGRFLRGAELKIPDEMMTLRKQIIPDDYIDFVRREELFMDRYIEAEIILYMNEKEIAILSFPTLNGIYDYRGFTSKDPNAVEWCKDLFFYYWDRSNTIPGNRFISSNDYNSIT